MRLASILPVEPESLLQKTTALVVRRPEGAALRRSSVGGARTKFYRAHEAVVRSAQKQRGSVRASEQHCELDRRRRSKRG